MSRHDDQQGVVISAHDCVGTYFPKAVDESKESGLDFAFGIFGDVDGECRQESSHVQRHSAPRRSARARKPPPRGKAGVESLPLGAQCPLLARRNTTRAWGRSALACGMTARRRQAICNGDGAGLRIHAMRLQFQSRHSRRLRKQAQATTVKHRDDCDFYGVGRREWPCTDR